MSAPHERFVQVNGHACRVLEKGIGPKVGYLAGLVGLPTWTPFLEELARTHHVVAPSLPGFPGATGYEDLDHLIDWLAATLDLLEQAGLGGADLIGASVGGTIAAEIAAMSPGMVRRLVLLAPLGLYVDAAPIPHLWAKRTGELNALLCRDGAALDALMTAPSAADPVEWNLQQSRSAAAASRLLWPMCDLGLSKRLHRIHQPTLVLWGDDDSVIPADPYARLFADGVSGESRVEVVAAAGHWLDLDAPAVVARSVERFLERAREAALA